MTKKIDRRAFLSAGAACISLPVILQLAGCNESESPGVSKKHFSDPKYELLDLALQHEFGAVVQYGHHSGSIAALGKDRDGGIGSLIMGVIQDEIQHAIYLTKILKKNGIEPTVAVWPPQSAPTAYKMLEKDIAAESGAVKLYQQILTMDFDDIIKKEIEIIMQSEIDHHNTFSQLLAEVDTV